MRAHTKAAVLVVSAGLLLTACGGETRPEQSEPTPHGYVEGAEETAEAQSRLVLADPSGAVRVLDLITEEVTRLDDVPGVEGISTDGRFAYLAAGRSTHVVDSGSWMVDHGDHVHYYRADIRGAGRIDGNAVAAHSDSAVTAVVLEDGTSALLDRPALEDGDTRARQPVNGVAVPYGQRLLVATGDGIAVRERDGEGGRAIGEPCPDPEGTAVTRRGVVFGCADGALLVSEDDGTFTGEKIPYPGPVPDTERAAGFTHRPGSATLAATAGERGVWSLDVSQRSWSRVETGPVVAVNAVGEGGPLLTLTADGVLHAYDSATGERLASRPLLSAPVEAGTTPVIQVDTSRAYVNDPAGRRVYEVDYNDDLRVARTFDLDITPSHLVETGR
ncbi:WD40 repeat domain-containing protein [Prauserella flavalba]|uniref:ABC transporter n=1 Tax=Prauserella flavalba TaxID=1477506 RepID=A0A318LPF9_9PSEU|nr:hypothetical protein [Prauserella flavalba]PXY36281.1 hypothetical protein BA062_12740 [Prauserella flavalba]